MNSDNPVEDEVAAAGAHLNESKSHVLQAADELRAAASQKAQQIRSAADQRATNLRDSATQTADRLKTAALDGKQRFTQFADEKMGVTKDRAKHYHEEGEQFVRDNPTKAILTAVGVGFVLGVLFRR